MLKAEINSNISKSKQLVFLEYVLLAICLCVIALRTTFTESPATQSTGQPINLGNDVYSLIVSAVLMFSFVIWFVWSSCSRKFYYRFTAIEIGLCLFCAAAVVVGLAAPNKRTAITSFAVLVAPMLMALLLVQILDSHSKIKVVLLVIAALGVVSAYSSADQFFTSNRITIEQYEQAPETMLEPLGIRPGTFSQWLLEHRLYSRGVRGFFTTGNSAGSFALLASFAAVALFLEKFRNRKSDASALGSFLAPGLAVAAVLFGLAITRSKGAIGASIIAAAMFVSYLLFTNWLKAHKKAILIVCLLLAVGGGCVVVFYGITHDRLPGGNSMLVRWQYWTGAAKMYADHPLTGIGPGNFAYFYPHYKPAAALESVADPHNFLLSILTQYGPLGLVGFLAMVFLPLWCVISPSSTNEIRDTRYDIRDSEPAFKKLAFGFVIVISAALLIIRPIVYPVPAGQTPGVVIYILFILYVMPVIAFAVGFWLLTASRNTQYAIRNTNITAAALFCACLGVLVHNTIDFAIFEPGVFTAFWAIMACLLALYFNQRGRTPFVSKHPPLAKVVAGAAGLVIIWAYFNYAFIPAAKATAKIKSAVRRPQYAHELLGQAAELDQLDPLAPNLNGRFYLQHYRDTGKEEPALLEKAGVCFLAAIERNSADFKNFEKLTEVYILLAETSTQQEKTGWLNRAFDSADRAVELYPGCARLRIELAKIAEQLARTNIAVRHYKEAIDIEDSYRRQFQIMYPGRKIFSRLGEEKYQFAKQQVKHLSEKPTP